MASRKKKAPAKKASKKAAKKSAPVKKTKKAAAKKAAPKKKKASAKKASAKKAAPAKKKSAAKKSAKKAPKKGASAASAKSLRAKKAKAKSTPRPQRGARPAKPARVRREDPAISLATGREPPRRSRETSLPADHEQLDTGPLKGEPVEKDMVIEAVRAALQAVEEHPLKGRAVLGRRNLVDLPQEGDLDYAIAQEAQKAAREVLEADATAREEQREVDERIAQVYASEAQDAAADEEEES